ncbi:MAG: hypothetical protein PHI05_02410 [Bacilli bacterium]|nr:hypothetical protein [Bacilli bacterium]MDD4547577.1 hypothetical protein [Bacilli bacterium]
MKKILTLLLLVLLVGCAKENIWKETEDSIKFKEEYEVLNGTKNTSGTEYLKIEVPSANPIKYLTIDETLEFLENGTGILYFGRPGCPYCRSTLNTFLDFAKDNEIEVINYYNPETIRNEGTDEYKKILEILDEYLKVDTVTQSEEDENFDPTLKRLGVPDVYFMNKGRVIGHYQESRAEFKGVLTKDQEKGLKEIYNEIYSDYVDSISLCTEEC